MIRYIRWCAYFCALLLLALLVNIARVQVWESAAYGANPANKRPAIERYAEPRGDILVDGRPVTGSRDSGQLLRFERTYTHGPLYAPVTGFSSQTYGTSFVERAEDAVLSGTDPGLSAFPLWYDLARGRPAAGTPPSPSAPPCSGPRTPDSAASAGRWPPSNRPPGGSSRWSAAPRTTLPCSRGRVRGRRRPGRR